MVVYLGRNKTGNGNTDSFGLILVRVHAIQVTNTGLVTLKFRDTSAWYHLVVALDTTQGTAANRLKVMVKWVEKLY